MKISEVTRIMGISSDTLRYYEKEGLITNVQRINGIRNYSEYDLKRIEFVKCLRHAGVSIQSLRIYLSLVDQGDETAQKRKEILIEQRDRILDESLKLKEVLDLMNSKIRNYDEVLLKREETLLKNDSNGHSYKNTLK